MSTLPPVVSKARPVVAYTVVNGMFTARVGAQVAHSLSKREAARQAAADFYSRELRVKVEPRDVAIYASTRKAGEDVAVHCPVRSIYRGAGMAASTRRESAPLDGSICDALFGELTVGTIKLARGARS